MNKKETIVRMSKDAGITALQAAKAFSSLLEGVKGTLRRGGKVTFSGFGSFEVKQRKRPCSGKTSAIRPMPRG